jgi:hypothetical protein
MNLVDAASCRILGKSGKMPLLLMAFMNYRASVRIVTCVIGDTIVRSGTWNLRLL